MVVDIEMEDTLIAKADNYSFAGCHSAYNTLLNIWDLFSQNERQVARELKEIWFIDHFKKSIENKGILQGKNSSLTPNKAATMTCNISF